MKPVVRVFEGIEEITAAARDFIVQAARSSIAARGRFDLVLSGGRTPESVYKGLVGADIEWKRVHVFFGDERCVKPDHADSNYGMARAAFLSKVSIPAANVHRMTAEIEAYRAAENYEIELKKSLKLDDGEWPRFDLILMGLGADGHTASLFPGSSAVDDMEQLCCATWVEAFKAYRVTLTYPVFDNAARLLFLACGADKSAAFRLATAERVTDSTPPAGRIRPTQGELVWYVDRATAGS